MEQNELQEIWREILGKLRESIVESACQRWLDPIKPLSLSEGELTLITQNKFSKEYIENLYIPFIKNAAMDVLHRPVDIILQPAASEEPAKEAAQPTLFAQPQPVSEAAAEEPSAQQAPKESQPLAPIPPGDRSSMNPKYTFDTFVTGSSNKLAHAAALAVAEAPGKAYNPLFMYGSVGLGKTHLMQAIGNQILQNDPTKRVLYISSEKFTNELINSIMEGKSESFRQKYRTIDVLLVDDIQFLYKKEHTQEEFFRTFNTLYDAGKQIILSSDRHPKEIQTLEERLRSRFEWGLITDIQAPDLETRIAILKKKAIMENIDVPNDVLYYIASRINSNIRELEGALTRVVAFASLNGQQITTELVAEAMKNIYPTTKTVEITIELIQEIVAQYFKIKVEALLSSKRTRELVIPRQIAMYLCCELTDISLPNIAGCFGRDHTTVIHARDKITEDITKDNKLETTIKDLRQRIERVS
ncbi:chromosomal replication initiator protein DnaA [Schwartzia sp. (in: firmicutes)]